MHCQRSCSKDAAKLSLKPEPFDSKSSGSHSIMQKESEEWAPGHLEKTTQVKNTMRLKIMLPSFLAVLRMKVTLGQESNTEASPKEAKTNAASPRKD